MLAICALAAAAFGVVQNRKTPAPAPPQQPQMSGKYFRQNVKVQLNDEFFDINITVACNVRLAKQFGPGAIMPTTIFYAERTKKGHAIGVRPTSLCSGLTTENGGAPPDLLPSIYWFEDADDLSRGIMYATEDAYTNKLSQLKFLGSTIHEATVEEFETFRQNAQGRNMLPWDGTAFWRDEKYGGADFTLDEFIAAGGHWPKPNWRVGERCSALQRIPLTEEERALVTPKWPVHKPDYWSPDPDTADRLRATFRRMKLGKPTRYREIEFRPPDVDGLPTRSGGGMLKGWAFEE